MLQLTIRFDDQRQTQVFAIDGETTIGRHSDNSLPIKSTFLSAFHAEIKPSSQGGYQINDLDSFNGTFVNGLRISQHSLQAGDELMLGTLLGKVTERGMVADFSENRANEKTKTPSTSVALNGRGGRRDEALSETTMPSANGASTPVPARTEVAARALRRTTHAEPVPIAKVEKKAPAKTQQSDLFAIDQTELRQQVESFSQQCDSRSTEIAEQIAASAALAASLATAKKATVQRDQEIVQLRVEISDLETLEKRRQAELAERDDEIFRFEDSLLKVRAASDESAAVEAELRAQLATADSERDTLHRELGARCERVAELEVDLVRSNTGAEQLKVATSGLGEQVERLTADRDQKLSDLADAQRQIERWQAKLGERDASLAASDQKHRAARKQIAELASDLADTERARADLAATGVKLASDIVAAETDLAKRGAAFESAEQRVHKVESERDLIAAELEELRTVHKDVAAAASHIGDVRQQAKRIDFDIDSQRTVLARERQALKDFEATAAMVRADLETEQKRLRDEISASRESLGERSAKRTLAGGEHRQQGDQLETDVEALGARLHARRAELAAAEQQRSEIDRRTKQAERALHKVEHKLTRRSNLLEQLRGLRRRERALRQHEKQLGSDLGSASPFASLDQGLEEKQKAHHKTVTELQRKLRDAAKTLDKKLCELRLADERIRFSEQLDGDVAARKRELAEITGQFEAATEAVRHLQEERQNLSTIVDQLDLDLASRGDEAALERHGKGKGIGLSSAQRYSYDEDANLPEVGAGLVFGLNRRPDGEDEDRPSGFPQLQLGAGFGNRTENSARTESRLRDLKAQIADSENYLRIVRESLRLDDATVRVLSQQIIKRLDLIDDLVVLHTRKGNRDVVEQLGALNSAFLDLLLEHSVEPYSFEPGTQLSMARRRRIKIVESRPDISGGRDLPHIIETLRPGYLCPSLDAVDDLIIRKAEVITANT